MFIDNTIPALNARCGDDSPPPPFDPGPPSAPTNPLQTADTPLEQRSPTIFVSYSRQDTEIVQRLIADLQRGGHAVWIDTSSIKSDEVWSKSISAGITNSYAFVTVVSQAANDSKWVEREYHWADQRGKRIFVVQVEACELPIYLVERQATRLFDDYDAGLRRLLASVPVPTLPTTHEATSKVSAPKPVSQRDYPNTDSRESHCTNTREGQAVALILNHAHWAGASGRL